jgi:hypothetical protein
MPAELLGFGPKYLALDASGSRNFSHAVAKRRAALKAIRRASANNWAFLSAKPTKLSAIDCAVVEPFVGLAPSCQIHYGVKELDSAKDPFALISVSDRGPWSPRQRWPRLTSFPRRQVRCKSNHRRRPTTARLSRNKARKNERRQRGPSGRRLH